MLCSRGDHFELGHTIAEGKNSDPLPLAFFGRDPLQFPGEFLNHLLALQGQEEMVRWCSQDRRQGRGLRRCGGGRRRGRRRVAVVVVVKLGRGGDAVHDGVGQSPGLSVHGLTDKTERQATGGRGEKEKEGREDSGGEERVESKS